MNNQFLTNYSDKKFLDVIKENLRCCDSFLFSVSFIKRAGLTLLINDIEAALSRGVKGRIITSTYQNFTDIESLRKFLELTAKYQNFECHLDYNCFKDEQNLAVGYHSKGYIFTFKDECEIIVGSSNITRAALLKNIEWDLLIREDIDSYVYHQTINEFNSCWNKTYPLNLELIKKYSSQLEYAVERWDMDYDRTPSSVRPNYMQRTALKELNRYRAMGIGRALIISAAGSGKTYLAAFDAFNFNPKRLLFIVHESSILKKALETFRTVFGPDIKYGLYTGESKNIDADFIFATNILMSRDLDKFARDDFDYIVIDECHHAVADSYKQIIEYFEPEFLLGLTATPERMDNQDVFELFEKNVPYELRLRDAIINDLVVPFHYYGIRDKMIDYGLLPSEDRKMIAQIADADHCQFIRDEIEKHRPEGKLKALVFCKNVTHARQMAEALGEYYHTDYLTGKNTVGERITAYNDLQDDNAPLEILCSVGILNEGVDIPGVNMVLFLRPTESSTIFIQQLGRGLRKYENKQYVTVLDFIGNSYKRSVQIAFALGSLSENLVLEKKLMMSLVKDDFAALNLAPFGVEINIDELSKEEISEFLENENFNSISYLKQDYFNFKKYVNSQYPPRHMDYLNNDCAPDLLRFMNIKIAGKKTECYYSFLEGIAEENIPTFSDEQIKLLKYTSSYLPLVRPHEFLIFAMLIDSNADIEILDNELSKRVKGYEYAQLSHALKVMQNENVINLKNGKYEITAKLDEQFLEHFKDLIEYGLTKYEADYINGEEFLLWHTYTKASVQLKLLKNPNDIMKGTYTYGKRVIIFASIKKDASVEELLNYKDKFLEPRVFQWETVNNVSANELQGLINSDEALLFIRKVEAEHGIVQPFIYTGKGKLTNPRRRENIDSTTGKHGVTYLFDILMDEELPDYLQYDFGLIN